MVSLTNQRQKNKVSEAKTKKMDHKSHPKTKFTNTKNNSSETHHQMYKNKKVTYSDNIEKFFYEKYGFPPLFGQYGARPKTYGADNYSNNVTGVKGDNDVMGDNTNNNANCF